MRIKYVSSAEEHGAMSWVTVYRNTYFAQRDIEYFMEEYYDELLDKYNNNFKLIFTFNGVEGVCAVYMQLIKEDKEAKTPLSRIVFVGYVLAESSPYFNIFDLTEGPMSRELLVDSNIFSHYFYSQTLPPFLVTLRKLDSNTQAYAEIPFDHT